MLKIINNLNPFFEDCYRRINVREYAKIIKVSPPTASKLLLDFYKEGLLKRKQEKQYIYYYANKDSDIFIDISRIYWKLKLKDLLEFLKKEFFFPTIILFGSLSKAEVLPKSDIDLAVFTSSRNEINPEKYEKVLKRKIEIFVFKNRTFVENKKLLNNILNGYKLIGYF